MAAIRGGVFTRADARACGYDTATIDQLLRGGAWRAVGRGRYALRGVLQLVDDEMVHLRRVWALLRDGPPGLAASHQSAAAIHALPLWGLDLSTVHVTSRDGRAGRVAGGVHRHVAQLPAVRAWNGMRLVGPERVVAELAATAPAEIAVVVADAARHAGLVSPATLAVAVSTLDSGRRRARSVLTGSASRSCSVGESRIRHLLRTAGLPAPADRPPPLDLEYAAEYPDPYPALWFPDQRTVIEFDPYQHFWGDHTCYSLGVDPFADAFATDEPPPAEYVWIGWSDLADPALVLDRITTAFARATTRTAVHHLNPHRRARRRTWPPRTEDTRPC